MLVLNRRNDEDIDMTLTQTLPAGTRLRVKLIVAEWNRARIGIDAPRSVTVDRHEITLRKDNGGDNVA